MPEHHMPQWLAVVIVGWCVLVTLGIPAFLWGVPGSLSEIARQLRRIADAKEKK